MKILNEGSPKKITAKEFVELVKTKDLKGIEYSFDKVQSLCHVTFNAPKVTATSSFVYVKDGKNNFDIELKSLKNIIYNEDFMLMAETVSGSITFEL